MNFRININGNSAQEFIAAGLAVREKAQELERALVELRLLIHGRNYQTLPNAKEAYEADLRVLEVSIRKAREVDDFATQVALDALGQE